MNDDRYCDCYEDGQLQDAESREDIEMNRPAPEPPDDEDDDEQEQR